MYRIAGARGLPVCELGCTPCAMGLTRCAILVTERYLQEGSVVVMLRNPPDAEGLDCVQATA